jgi:DNA-binding transcriptional MocR family regulator
VVERLASHKVPLFEDNVYGELYFGSKRPLPAKAFDKKDLVMHCSSFSKFIVPGQQIGWAVPGRF